MTGAGTATGIACRPSSSLVGLTGARVLVMGLGRFGGGVGVTRWLVSEGALVTVSDQADERALAESLSEIADLEVRLSLGGHRLDELDTVDLVIVNPAVVKSNSLFFAEIARRRMPWTTEMNLFCERCPAPVIGVTGTFGKSTTSAMIAAALEGCRAAGATGYTAIHLGGNIGVSLLPKLHQIRSTDLVVLEMSNAQLEDLPRIDWAPFGAVLTNLVPHHLDRYGGSFEAYADAKLHLVAHPARTEWFVHGPVHSLVEGRIAWPKRFRSGAPIRVGRAEPPIALNVPGEHNQANAACALTVCRVMGLPDGQVRAALGEFRGLPHRLEFVRSLNGVDYLNDSKSTAPTASVVALRSIERPVVCVLGGQVKPGVELGLLAEASRGRCRAMVCFGESGPMFASAVRHGHARGSGDSGGTRREPGVHVVGSVTEAVPLARDLAQVGDVVLFSPGAPSFDAYKNYVQRGEHFAALVRQLS